MNTDTLMNIADRWLGLRGAVLAAVAAGAISFGLVKSMYESTSTVYVESREDVAQSQALMGLNVGATQRDAYVLKEYIHSHSLFEDIDAQLGLVEHYSQGRLFGLSQGDSKEEKLAYWQSITEVDVDEQEGLTRITVRGYEPAFTQQIANKILESSELYINDIGWKAARTDLDFARAELERARDEFSNARRQQRDLQVDFDNPEPLARYQAALKSVAEQEGVLQKAQAQLEVLAGYHAAGSMTLKMKQSEVDALKKALDESEQRLLEFEGDSPEFAKYESAEMMSVYASKLIEGALLGITQAKYESMKQLKDLGVVTSPSVPEESTYPNKSKFILAVFIGWLIIGYIVKAIIKTIREGAEI